MTPKGSVRIMKWQEGQRSQAPLKYADRGDFADVSWIGGTGLGTLEHRLQLIDRGFEIIYDRATARDSMQPAHHLYRVIRRGGSPHDDHMVLEFSLQEDLDKPWPKGIPKAPGDWIIAAIRERLKDNFTGSESQVQAQMDAARDAGNIKKQADVDRKAAEMVENFERETQPYITGQKTLNGKFLREGAKAYGRKKQKV